LEQHRIAEVDVEPTENLNAMRKDFAAMKAKMAALDKSVTDVGRKPLMAIDTIS
jgi:hypothetical protein